MRGNFTHVLAFSKVDNSVVVINPLHSHTSVDLRMHPEGCHLELHPDFIALDFAAHGGTVVKITRDVDQTFTSHAITNFFPGCVTMAKQLLGVAEWVFTPWQFYRWLLENGGELYSPEKQDAIIAQVTGCHPSEVRREQIFQYLRKER